MFLDIFSQDFVKIIAALNAKKKLLNQHLPENNGGKKSSAINTRDQLGSLYQDEIAIASP